MNGLTFAFSYQIVIDLVTKMGVGHENDILNWQGELKELISVSSYNYYNVQYSACESTCAQVDGSITSTDGINQDLHWNSKSS